MEERMMRRVADSAVIQTQLVLNSHLNGAGRLFGGQLMEWIDIVATVVARRHAHCNPTTAAVDNLQFKEAVHLNNMYPSIYAPISVTVRVPSTGRTLLSPATSAVGAEKR